MDDRLTQQLVSLGLRTNEARAYLALLRHGPVTAAEVADSAGISRPKVYEALKALEREGFCLPYADGASRFQAVAPEIAFSELLRRREHSRLAATNRDQEVARSILDSLPLDFAASDGGAIDGYMVAVVGGDAMLGMFRGIAERAEHQLDVVLSTPQVAPLSVGLQPEIDALGRGVTIRIICEKSLLLDTETDLTRLVEAGAEARWLADIPLRLALRDSGAEGLVALVARSGDDFVATSIGIKHSELVAPFQILFNRQWRQASPISNTRRASPSRQRRKATR